MSKKKIFFWADASQTIGYGHFIRTLALADILKDDFDCFFYTQTPSSYQKESVDKVCKLIELPNDDRKFNYFLEYLSGNEIVVLDNFFFTTEYQKIIKNKGCKLVSLGLNDRHYYSDVVISQASTNKSSFSGEPYTQYCLGLNWALLRQPFYHIENTIPKSGNRHVFVCFGGSDYIDLSSKVATSLLNESSVEMINVLVGDVYKGQVEEIFDKKIKTYRNLGANDIVKLLNTCDVSIVSASSICIESLACKVPTFAGYYVDNQILFYNIINTNKNIVGLGNLLEYDFNVLFSKMKLLSDFHLTSVDFSIIPDKYLQLFKGLC